MVPCELGLHQLVYTVYLIGVQTYICQKLLHLFFFSIVWSFTGTIIMSLLLPYYKSTCSLNLFYIFFNKLNIFAPHWLSFLIAGKQLCCGHARTHAPLMLFYCRTGYSQRISNVWNCRLMLFGLGTSIKEYKNKLWVKPE